MFLWNRLKNYNFQCLCLLLLLIGGFYANYVSAYCYYPSNYTTADYDFTLMTGYEYNSSGVKVTTSTVVGTPKSGGFNQICVEEPPSYLVPTPSGSIGGPSNAQGQKTKNTPRDTTDCPVIIATGQKVIELTDYKSNGEFPLELSRRRIARTESAGSYIFGVSWHTDFTHHIYVVQSATPTAPTKITGNPADITEIKLVRYGVFSEAYTYVNGKWIMQGSGGKKNLDVKLLSNGTWQVTNLMNGLTELYDYEGDMIKRTNIHGVSWALNYISTNGGKRYGGKIFSKTLSSITHSSGRKLLFDLNNVNNTTTVTDHNGFKYVFERGNPNLNMDYWGGYGEMQVKYPENTGSYKLRGGYGMEYMEYVDDELYKVHKYKSFDGITRVESSGLGDGYLKTTFDYKKNQTIVTNAKGLATTYTYENDSIKLIALDRAGTAACPSASAGSGYYDNSSLVKWKDDWQGNRSHYTYNAVTVQQTTPTTPPKQALT